MTKALKERFDTLSDALIAIVMTVLVLEIKPPSRMVELPQFFHGLGLFVVSFIIILNFWYRRLQMMSHIEQTTYQAFYMDVAAHLTLCLFPVGVSMLLDFEVKWVAVLFYGVVNLVTGLLLNRMIRDLTVANVDHVKAEAREVKKWVNQRLIIGALTDLLTMLIAFKFPVFGIYLYVIAPFVEFYMNYKRGTAYDKAFKSGIKFETYIAKRYRRHKQPSVSETGEDLSLTNELDRSAIVKNK